MRNKEELDMKIEKCKDELRKALDDYSKNIISRDLFIGIKDANLIRINMLLWVLEEERK